MTSQPVASHERELPDSERRLQVVAGDATTITVISSRRSARDALVRLLESEQTLDADIDHLDRPGPLAAADGELPHVAVFDARGPAHDWVKATRAIVDDAPECALVVVTSGGDDDGGAARDALRAGARAFVPAARLMDDLIPAVQAALDGERWVSPTVGALLACESQPEDDVLTERERAVLQRLGQGHTNAEVARQLFISQRTVEAHRAALQRKLDVAGRAQLVGAARDRGLI